MVSRVRSVLTKRAVRRKRKPEKGEEVHFLGEKFHIQSQKKQVLDYLVSVFEDFVRVSRKDHENNQARQALAESEARFRATFEGAAIGIALADMKGRLVESNSAFQKMLGYSRDELFSMVFTEFTHPDDAAKDMDLYKELIAGKRDHYSMEKRYIRKDGRLVWSRLNVSMIRDSGSARRCTP